jgi:hypothetical protein
VHHRDELLKMPGGDDRVREQLDRLALVVGERKLAGPRPQLIVAYGWPTVIPNVGRHLGLVELGQSRDDLLVCLAFDRAVPLGTPAEA